MKKFQLLTGMLFFATASCFGQFSKLAEINQGSASSLATQKGAMAQVGNTLFFSAENGTNGVELWKTDGTTAGTKLVKDINPGAQGSDPDHFYAVGNLLLFTADNGTQGRELWKSDGTTAGTELLAEIRPGSSSPFEDWFFSLGSTDFQVFQNQLYFRAYTSDDGLELYKSDGTSAGTGLLKSISPGGNDGCQGDFEALNGELYFIGFTFQHGGELWKTDGTANGTVQVTNNLNETPEDLKRLGNLLIFVEDDGTSGPELWKSDGTQAGTSLLKNTDLASGSGGLSHQRNAPEERFFVAGSKAYFSVMDAQFTSQLWVTDGTPGGTLKLKTFDFSSEQASHFVQLGSQVLFLSNDFAADNLWKTTGSIPSTQVVTDLIQGVSSISYPNFLLLHAHDNQVWFTDEYAGNISLFKTNGTNTELVTTPSISAFYDPQRFFSFGDKMVFWAKSVSFNDNWEPYIYTPSLQFSSISTAVNCHGGNDGTILIIPSGVPPYQAVWNPSSAVGLNPDGLTAGTYSVTVTDANGTSGTTSVQVLEPAPINTTVSSTPQMGSTLNGTAGVSVIGGTAPYQYLWNTVPAQTTPIAVELAEGTYTCVVTDSKGCTHSAEAIVGYLVSTNESTNQNNFFVTPNPASTWLNLHPSDPADHVLKYHIFDAAGKLLRTMENPSGNNISLLGLSNGHFTLHFFAENTGWHLIRFQKMD